MEEALLANEADTAAYSGRLMKAREFSSRAAASAKGAEQKETAAGYEAGAALREALFGNVAEARQRATSALGLSTGRDAQCGAALALVFAGDARGRRRLPIIWIRTFQTTLSYDSTICQLCEVNLRSPEMTHRRQSNCYRLPLRTNWEPRATVPCTPSIVRGQAYLAAAKGIEGAVEFQKILDHRGVAQNEPIAALAHLGLARAYALQGDSLKARAAYNDFLTLWKDADPDIPILIAAKAEYAKLK